MTNKGFHNHLKLKADDVAVAIANALIQPKSKCRSLGVSSLHSDFGSLAYRALGYALSVNTSFEEINFTGRHRHRSGCCSNENDEHRDLSGGLFARALTHNRQSALKTLVLCPSAFGSETRQKLELVKPDLV